VHYQLHLNFVFVFTGTGSHACDKLLYWFLHGKRLGNTDLENTVLKNVL
jgi:hypothetical protein